MTDWFQRLPNLCEVFAPKDIFNAEETGLFYWNVPSRSLVKKGDSCKGGKNSKECVTLLLAYSSTVEKLPMMIIGKSANPRCFRGKQMDLSAVIYKANRKTWMTTALFQEYYLTK